MATVHSLRKERMLEGDVLVDRRTIFGNPFKLQAGMAPGSTIAAFEDYARKRVATDHLYRQMVRNLHGRRLFCWCKPNPCHGDVLARLAEELQCSPAGK